LVVSSDAMKNHRLAPNGVLLAFVHWGKQHMPGTVH